ncbi:hypothetical protein ACQP1W_19690 [Spirillospora sp. CA-255316]
MPPTPPLRLVRATVFAAVCVLLTSLAHFTASGMVMAPWTVTLGFAGVLAFAFTLSGHERSLPTILGGLLLGQFALHVLFAANHGQHHPGAAPPMAPDGGPDAAMTAAHLLAAAVSAWWLRRGERHAWRLARLAARVLILPFLLVYAASVPPERRPVAPPASPDVPRPVTAVLRHALVLRGPPVRSRALSGR